jgi:cytochrome c-type biogenesis protein CcmH
MRFLFLIFLLFSFPALAVEPDEMLRDKALEMRARDISRQLRCLVCQGEDIDDSGAELARDLRKLVRDRILAGDTDADVLRFLQERYGDFILLSPPVKGDTALLWLTPLVFFVFGTVWVFTAKVRRGRR